MSKTIIKRIALGSLATACLVLPAMAQDFSGQNTNPFAAEDIFGGSADGGYTISTRQTLHQEVLDANTEVALSFAGVHTQYHEDLVPGDDENGLTSGLEAGIDALVPYRPLGPNRDIYTALIYDFSAGNIAYGGHYLISGLPVTATDRAVFNRAEARLGVGFAFDRGFEITPFIAAGYQAWNRNVSNKGEIATDEFYHSFMFGGGIKFDLPLTTSLVASFSGEVMALAPGGIAINSVGINQNFGRTAEERVTFGLDQVVSRHLHLLANAFWEHFNYSGSKPKIYDLGGAFYEIYEPLSTTTQYGFDVGVAYNF